MQHDPAAAAWRSMFALAHNPETLDRLRRQLETLGLTVGVGKALFRLTPGLPVSMRQLAGALRCDNSYVTTVVDALEERGLAHRQPHPSDRRIKVIVLSEEGVEVRRRLEEIRSIPPAAFDVLNAEEAADLAALLAKIEARAAAGDGDTVAGVTNPAAGRYKATKFGVSTSEDRVVAHPGSTISFS
jgi:DNA-binding MarR family transcriptional regulator